MYKIANFIGENFNDIIDISDGYKDYKRYKKLIK
jgi:hypothetical protein